MKTLTLILMINKKTLTLILMLMFSLIININELRFYHEQSRPDRDSYVKVNWQNIQSDMAFNFDKYDNTVVNTLNTPYDYASIMHYEKTAFSINYLPAIEPTQTNKKIGQRY
ncbi:unnamed protein product, partial [Rotaria sordida]